MLDTDYAIIIHDEIIAELGGLSGLGQGGRGAITSALNRIEAYAYYVGVDDVFTTAALYAVAIARGHVFNDGNKRTGLTCALTYLLQQEISIPKTPQLEEIMVDVASGEIDYETFASILSTLWHSATRLRVP